MADKRQHIDDLLRDALGDYNAQPPVGAWANMESKLDKTSPVDHLFGEALSGYEETPPAGAWADMEARLDEKRRRRRGFVWYWVAAGLAGLLIGGYSLLNNNGRNTAGNEHHKTNVQEVVSAPQQEVAPPVTQTEPSPEKQTEAVTETENKMSEAVEQTPQIPNSPQRQKNTAPDLAQAPQKEKNAPPPAQQSADEKVVKNKPVQKENTLAIAQDEPVQKEPRPKVSQGEPISTTPLRELTGRAGDTIEDDIAAAMRHRTTSIVMNIKRSRYADSIAEIAAKDAVKQEKIMAAAKEETIPVAVAPEKEEEKEMAVVKEVASSAPDTMDEMVASKLQETNKVLEVAPDAILSASQKVQLPPDAVVFTGEERAVTQDDDGTDKGSLAAFIGPMPDTVSYAIAGSGSESAIPDAIARAGMQSDILFKVGYERGFDATALSKFVVAPGIRFRLSDKFDLMLQPTLKVGGVNKFQVNGAESYHEIVSSYVDSNSEFINSVNTQTGVTTNFIKKTYYFQETHDSIVVSHQYDKRKMVEADLPVMLGYKLSKNFSMYAGPVLTYSGTVNVNTKINKYAGGTRRDTLFIPLQPLYTPIESKAGAEVFTYNTKNIDTYDPAQYSNSQGNKFRWGYTAGMSYSLHKVSVDVSVQQNLSRLNYIPNAGVRNIYKQPYVRFMLGYKLYGNKK